MFVNFKLYILLRILLQWNSKNGIHAIYFYKFFAFVMKKNLNHYNSGWSNKPTQTIINCEEESQGEVIQLREKLERVFVLSIMSFRNSSLFRVHGYFLVSFWVCYIIHSEILQSYQHNLVFQIQKTIYFFSAGLFDWQKKV